MKILFVGDVMLGRLVNEVLKRERSKYPWGDTLSLFKQADLRICNLECVISDLGEPWSETPKVFHFRSDAKNISTLKKADINLVSLANNHAIDYGYEAMLDCLKSLDKADIRHIGAGINSRESSAPVIVQTSGINLGLIAFTDNEDEWESTATQPGIFFVPIELQDERAKKLFENIEQTKSQVDLLIVSAHWGGNWGDTPPPDHVSFAHALIDAGVDIIFGHSCHIFRGIEIYRRRPILYSAGDFIDDYAVDEIERNDQSFIFILETNGATIQRLKLFSTLIREFQARRADENESAIISEKMISLCEKLGTTASWNVGERCLEISIL